MDRKIEELTARIEGMLALRDELIKVRKRASALPAKEIAARARFCHIIENRALTAQRLQISTARGATLGSGTRN